MRPIVGGAKSDWEKYESRAKRHTDNVVYHVEEAWLGAEIYGNSFAARAKFLEYTCDFEVRLAEASKLQPGSGAMVFCLSGLQWRRSELEDLADSYLTGRHRKDDPLAAMEAYKIRKCSIELKRNVAAFNFLDRPMDCISEKEWIVNVRGPRAFHELRGLHRSKRLTCSQL